MAARTRIPMKHPASLGRILDMLQKFHGKPLPPKSILKSLNGRADPYEMILHANCGYPASDASCTKGFEALKNEVGLRPDDILSAPEEKLRAVLKLGGIVLELRAQRLREIAARVKHEFGGDLRRALREPLPQARKNSRSSLPLPIPAPTRFSCSRGAKCAP